MTALPGPVPGPVPVPVPVRGRRLGGNAALTAREREVAGLVAHGLTNLEIATELYISPTTAKFHVGRIARKLGAANRVEVVAWAWQSGLAADVDVVARAVPRAGSSPALSSWSPALSS